MNTFGNWKEHDVDLHNARVAASKPKVELAPIELPPKEKDLHEAISDYCRQYGWYFIHSRMDRRTTLTVGAPDFVVFKPNGKVLCIEAKRKGGKVTLQQQATIAHLRKLGHVAEVVDNWADAMALLITT